MARQKVRRLTQFGTGVPTTEQVQHTGEETRLNATDDESEGKHGTVAVCRRHGSAQGAPDNHDPGKEDGRTRASKNHVGGYLAQQVSEEEDGKHPCVALVVQVKIVSHAGDFGITLQTVSKTRYKTNGKTYYIGPIDIIENVPASSSVFVQLFAKFKYSHDPQDGHEKKINLPHELLLFRSAWNIVPQGFFKLGLILRKLDNVIALDSHLHVLDGLLLDSGRGRTAPTV